MILSLKREKNSQVLGWKNILLKNNIQVAKKSESEKYIKFEAQLGENT